MSSARRASAAPADPETRLFRAYGDLQPGQVGVFRISDGREPCACGGVITLTGRAIEAVVKAHNKTAKHAAWRAWREA